MNVVHYRSVLALLFLLFFSSFFLLRFTLSHRFRSAINARFRKHVFSASITTQLNPDARPSIKIRSSSSLHSPHRRTGFTLHHHRLCTCVGVRFVIMDATFLSPQSGCSLRMDSNLASSSFVHFKRFLMVGSRTLRHRYMH